MKIILVLSVPLRRVIALCLIATVLSTVAPAQENGRSVKVVPRQEILALSQQIDTLIQRGYTQHKITPNPIASDMIFMRRVFLDIAGRIPTAQEARAFLASKATDKRSTLIDILLDSEAYVSHQFNYFADLLRLKSRLPQGARGAPFIAWVKQALRENKPYDEMVREILTASGTTQDNPAVGYYLRDPGMPLDIMSNTTQIFLGTRVQCAQCHNHPFDKWTQKQFYEMAAYTFGVQSPLPIRKLDIYREVVKIYKKKNPGKKPNATLGQAVRLIFLPLTRAAADTKRKLRLPNDYRYDDAKPKSFVTPQTIFGDPTPVQPGDNPRTIYARWLTSPKNLRFTTVITNRLWKRAMGVGIIESVDNFKDDTAASNPELMKFLTKEMRARQYNIKQFYRMLYNTKTYQRTAMTDERDPAKPYYFPGAVLRRMSAEQMWDSMMTLIIPQLDARKSSMIAKNYRQMSEARNLRLLESVLKKNPTELYRIILDVAKVTNAYRKEQLAIRKKISVARSPDAKRTLRKQLRDKNQANMRSLYRILSEGKELPAAEELKQQQRDNADPRWRKFRRELVRAAEVTSPAPPGHFLRQFGQSDREVIENAASEATVPQILNLLNGPYFYQVFNNGAVLMDELRKATKHPQKQDALVLSVLGRFPTEAERKLMRSEVKAHKWKGYRTIVWALLNTREFMFIQ